MVDKLHYRWDFIGLSTDTKPTPSTSEKVVNGSTYYCSDNSKLYVWYKDQWYEKTATGGGGGTTYTAGDGITIADDTISVDLAQTTGSSTTKVMSQKATTDFVSGLIKAGSAPTTSTEGTLGQLYEDTTNGKLYQCTNASTTTTEEAVVTSKPDYLTVVITNQDTLKEAMTGDWSSVPATLTYVDEGGSYEWMEMEQSGMSYSDLSDIGVELTGTPNLDDQITFDITTTTTTTYTWTEIGGGGVTPVQTTGTSTTDVMSQNAVTSMIYADASTPSKIRIGNNNNLLDDSMSIGVGTNVAGTQSTAIGNGSKSTSSATAMGFGSEATAGYSVAIGFGAKASGLNSIGFSFTNATRQGEMALGLIGSQATQGYNNTAYRLISGVHDGQGIHDVATVAQGNTLSASAPTTSTEGVLGQLWTDTTNMHTYQCTAISGNTYTWTQRW